MLVRKRSLPLVVWIGVSLAGLAPAQNQDSTELAALVRAYLPKSFDLLREALSIPNDAHFPEQVHRNVEWARKEFQERGFRTVDLPTGGPPLLLAERDREGAARTVLIYLHMDGQPVDPAGWNQPDPYRPVLKELRQEGWQEVPWNRLADEPDPEWRIFARSASDAKGPAVMLLTALDALDGESLKQTFNIKIVMDFEEELGSPHLPLAVERYRGLLMADMMLILDGPRHLSNRPTLSFGARGIATLTIRVFGPRSPQHSGHYGNYVPNPAVRLAQLLASMKDGAGRVVIPGFYEGVEVNEETRRILAETPDDEAQIRARLGFAHPDAVGGSYQEAIQYPSLNIRGLSSAWVGDQARTIIPSTATAEIDIRLVPETDAERLIQLVRSHVENQGYYLIEGREPTDDERASQDRIAAFTHEISYGAFRTPYDSEVGIWLERAMIRAFGEPPIRIRMEGGSVPIAPFVLKLGIPAVSVPTVNRDNNQHSPDENLRVGNYGEGVRTFLAILTQPFTEE